MAVPSSLRLDPRQSSSSLCLFVAVLWWLGVLWPLLVCALPLWLASLVALEKLTPLLHGRALRVPPGRTHAVLVTGCSSGLGRAAAEDLARRGFLVVASVRRQGDADALRRAVDGVETVIMDVADDSAVARAALDTRAALERAGAALVGVVNNAGYSEMGPVEAMPLAAVRRQLEVNVVGQVAVAQAFLPLLREGAAAAGRRARLVFMASMGGRVSVAGVGMYCASKHAVEAIGDALRQELHPWPVDVVVVEPGCIRTEFADTADRTLKTNFAAGEDADPVRRTYAACVERMVAARDSVPQAPIWHNNEALAAALLDERPLTRYFAAYDARFALPILALVPDTWRDFLLGQNFRVKAVLA